MHHKIVIWPMLAATIVVALLVTLLATSCATAPSKLPYPAFVQTGELDGVFTAALPGTRAKQMYADHEDGSYSILLTLPEDWRWNTGGAPGKYVEIFVLDGEITLGDLTLRSGNYAYLPSGSTRLPMSTLAGARVLYFLDEADPHAIIRTPLFMSRDVLPWQPISDDPADSGLQIKVLRYDPGSGARTWLLKIDPGRSRRWHKSSVMSEGFLLSGDYRQSVCWNGQPVTGDYLPGGYFRRPAAVVNGGPESGSEEGAIWLLREPARGVETFVDACRPEPVPSSEG